MCRRQAAKKSRDVRGWFSSWLVANLPQQVSIQR
jgi:hypothetical protein